MTFEELKKLSETVPAIPLEEGPPKYPCVLIADFEPDAKYKLHVWHRPKTDTEPAKTFRWSVAKNGWTEVVR